MKKRIQTMIILAALLLSTATGCQNRADNLPGCSSKDLKTWTLIEEKIHLLEVNLDNECLR